LPAHSCTNILLAPRICSTAVDGWQEGAMEGESRQAHWENVYVTKRENEVSWFQETPAPSLALIVEAGAAPASGIIDIGGGASRLVDHLIEDGFHDVTVLDLSAAALDAARTRLGDRAGRAHWLVADATTWQPSRTYDIWHDRAAFHFLTEARDREGYIAHLRQALKIGGHAIIATFALDGPEKCSGLPVERYDAARLGQTLGSGFTLLQSRRNDHATPWGSRQRFQFSVFQRVA
jgi:SAM-dependent methyltransferase